MGNNSVLRYSTQKVAQATVDGPIPMHIWIAPTEVIKKRHEVGRGHDEGIWGKLEREVKARYGHILFYTCINFSK